MASVRSFYGNKISQHRFMNDAINQIEADDPQSADIVMIGPPTEGQDSDLEHEDEDFVTETGLPDEVAGELEVMQYSDDDDNNETFSLSDEKDYMPSNNKRYKETRGKGKHTLLPNQHHQQNRTKRHKTSCWVIRR